MQPDNGSTMDVRFRPYTDADFQACTGVFDTNCPEFFAPNERQEYERFLEGSPKGYEVCEVNGRVLGAFGLLGMGKERRRLNWILVDPGVQGIGVGSKIMERVILKGRTSGVSVVEIAASQKSAPFFAKYGATRTSTTKDGFGPGMDRVEMVLHLVSRTNDSIGDPASK